MNYFKRNLIDISLIGILAVCLIMVIAIVNPIGHQYKSAKRASVKLQGIKGQCSGVQIETKSHNKYILSAGHCAHLNDNNELRVTDESGRVTMRRIIAEDVNSDLLLIEADPQSDTIQIADSSHIGDKIKTWTHGAGLDTYMTQGELIQYKDINIMISIADNPEQEAACRAVPKNRIEYIEMFGIPLSICELHLHGLVSTANVVPGSSGGMVVKNEKLVGIVSATDGHFGYFVGLEDIHRFIDNY